MATDLELIVRNLTDFYDFVDKTVIAVGAGGGPLAEYGRRARRVIAVDHDASAMERLSVRVRERRLADKFTLVHGDLLTVRPTGDVVLFEFCLHEMPDPLRALDHARLLARDVLVIDHAPGSPWEWYAAEEAGIEAGWAAVARGPVRLQRDVEAFQHFNDFAELETRLARQGATSKARIAAFRGQQPIFIAMPYRLALLDYTLERVGLSR